MMTCEMIHVVNVAVRVAGVLLLPCLVWMLYVNLLNWARIVVDEILKYLHALACKVCKVCSNYTHTRITRNFFYYIIFIYVYF